MPSDEGDAVKTLVCVEGPIGVGKSTLITELRKRASPASSRSRSP